MWLIVLLNWHFCDFLLYLSQSKYEDQGNFPVFAAGQHSFGLFLLMAPLSRCWSTPGEILSQISRLTCAVNICAGALVSGWPNMASWPEAPTTILNSSSSKTEEWAGRKVAVEPVAVEVVQTHNLINLPSSPLKCNCSCFGAICKVLSEEINLFDFVRIFGKSSTYNFNNGSVRLPADQNLAHLTGHQTNCLPDLWHLGSLKALPPPSIHLNMEDMGNGAKKKERKLLKIGEQIHW